MTLFITVEISGMTQVLASHAGNIGGMFIGGWEGTKVISNTHMFIKSSCQQFEWDRV